MNVCRACGLTKAHFTCRSCGMHTLLNSLPCSRCRYFRFDVVEAAPQDAPMAETVIEQPDTSPAATQKTKRRPRGVADIQRN